MVFTQESTLVGARLDYKWTKRFLYIPFNCRVGYTCAKWQDTNYLCLVWCFVGVRLSLSLYCAVMVMNQCQLMASTCFLIIGNNFNGVLVILSSCCNLDLFGFLYNYNGLCDFVSVERPISHTLSSEIVLQHWICYVGIFLHYQRTVSSQTYNKLLILVGLLRCTW